MRLINSSQSISRLIRPNVPFDFFLYLRTFGLHSTYGKFENDHRTLDFPLYLSATFAFNVDIMHSMEYVNQFNLFTLHHHYQALADASIASNHYITRIKCYRCIIYEQHSPTIKYIKSPFARWHKKAARFCWELLIPLDLDAV